MGALATGGVRVLNDNVVRMLDIPADAVEAVVRTEQRELDRRERLYRDARPPPELRGRTVILVDDGLATGSTMLAAVRRCTRSIRCASSWRYRRPPPKPAKSCAAKPMKWSVPPRRSPSEPSAGVRELRADHR